MRGLSRRQLILAGLPLTLAASRFFCPVACAAAADDQLGAPQLFGFNTLREMAKGRAAKPYVAPKRPVPDIINKIDFDVVQKIKFRAERALWGDGPGPFPIRLFHLDKFNPLPVRINILTGDQARRVNYSASDFDYGDTGLEARLPADLGFSGFRVMDNAQAATDWLAFQGASYFRSAGQDNQYGGSARGIAVDTVASRKEEFPRFAEFWLAEPESQSPSVTIYALLDGPSLAGAYRFVAAKKTGVVMDAEAELFVRNDVAQLGIAPLTSMYWYGENQRQGASDWRPEIHDSDGLQLWTGKGERIWRPLIDPPSVLTNTFLDQNPKGFGLMQRDRTFADYQDDGAFYNRRPSMWVETKGDWGAGAVQLVEIPTQDEIHDNIVVFWNPKDPVKAGAQLKYAYRLFWQNGNPDQDPNIGHAISTRIGRGGVPGHAAPTDKDSWKFVIDFAGGPLAQMAPRFDVTPVVTTSRGKVGKAYVVKVVGTDHWRALVDVLAPGKEQINLRCFLRLGDKTLTETWLYQYFPPA